MAKVSDNPIPTTIGKSLKERAQLLVETARKYEDLRKRREEVQGYETRLVQVRTVATEFQSLAASIAAIPEPVRSKLESIAGSLPATKAKALEEVPF